MPREERANKVDADTENNQLEVLRRSLVAKSIGIDIGSSSIRAVETQYNGKTLKVLRAAEEPLDRGIVVSGAVREPEALTEAVRRLWKTGKFSGKTVSVGLNGTETLIRQVELPWEKPEIFKESLPLRVGSDLPVDPSEMTLDYYPLDDITNGTSHVQKALIVASVNAFTENIADSLLQAGLKLKRADYSPFALIRAAVIIAGNKEPVPGELAPGEEWDCEVVVDVGGQNTIIAIHHLGRPLFVRVVPNGTEGVTRALATELKLHLGAAEAVRRTLGLGGVDGEANTNVADVDLTQAQIKGAEYITNAMSSSLVQVVRESVEYYMAASPQITSISRVLLSGGGALLPGYADRVASELRAPVEMLAPLHKFATGRAVAFKNLDPRLTIAVGLSLEVK